MSVYRDYLPTVSDDQLRVLFAEGEVWDMTGSLSERSLLRWSVRKAWEVSDHRYTESVPAIDWEGDPGQSGTQVLAFRAEVWREIAGRWITEHPIRSEHVERTTA